MKNYYEILNLSASLKIGLLGHIELREKMDHAESVLGYDLATIFN